MAAVAAAFAALLLGLRLAGVELVEITRDATDVAGAEPWVGLVSTLGLMLWSVAVGACLTAGLAARARADQQEAAKFLLATAALLALLALDDAFLLHEEVLPDTLGLPEPVGYALAASAVALWAWLTRRSILRSDLPLLFVAGAALGASVVMDVLTSGHDVPEDYLKYVGLGALTVWSIGESLRALAGPAHSDRREAATAPIAGADRAPLARRR